MQQIPETVLNAAMSLSPDSRGALAEQLWLSVDEKDRAEVEAAWTGEIEKRTASLDRGETKLIPGEQVMREARVLVGSLPTPLVKRSSELWKNPRVFRLPRRLSELFEQFSSYDLDYRDVRGQEMAKRAMTIAAASICVAVKCRRYCFSLIEFSF